MNPLIWLLVIGGGLAVVLLIAGLVISRRSERSLVEERLGRYLEDEFQTSSAKTDKKQSTPLTDWINARVEKTSFGEGIARELARADLKVKPGEYVAFVIIICFGLALIGYFLLGGPIAAAIAAVVGLFIPRMYIKGQQQKRLQRFAEQLPDMLNLMVNGLRAGYSTMQAMEAVSRELPPPLSDEFRRVVQEMQLGIPMERALDNLLRRIPSEDLDFVVTAINVQREVGGNLAEIMDTISFTIRERVRIKGEIRVLTSQVMYSGRFLSILPLILMGILWVINRPYMMRFFNPETRTCGLSMLGCGGLMIVAGYFVMNKIGDIEV
ncbi:MAG: type II secretion system F family protein [Anaerolineales bacterium]